jgi:hypothetical protein
MLSILRNIQISKRNLLFLFSFKKEFFFNRKQRRREHPTSPNKYRKCSRRCFDGQLRTWRRNLHQFDDGTNQDTAGIIELDELTLTE